MIRTHLVKSLYTNLVGPINGPTETVEQPYIKYQMGILESCYHSKNITTLDPGGSVSDSKNFNGYSNSPDVVLSDDNDVQSPDTEIDMGGSFTLGVSFVLKGKSPKIKICSTWGRYVLDGKTPKNLGIFQRKPNYFLTDWLDISSYQKESESKINLDPFDSVITKSGIELWIRSRFNPKNEKWTVQVFLVNRTKYSDKNQFGKPQRQTEVDRIFQPQIRINCKDSDLDYLGHEEEEELEYLKSGTRAKGFQCAAMWDEIDPESKEGNEFRTFTWADASSNLLSEQIVKDFSKPHIRTEYIPTYSIMQPELSERRYDADFFSNSWNIDKIIKGSPKDSIIGLNQLVKSYGDWISAQADSLTSPDFLDLLPNDTKQKLLLIQKGEDAIAECKTSLDEIQKGIDFLKDDERARLSFCFMNSVMSDNRKYSNLHNPKSQKLYWREFQMAFILQSLRGVVGDDKGEQNFADVLWFPTGGGKTEAYLGIIIFASAYRRLLEQEEISNKFDMSLNNDGGVCAISRYTLRLLTIQQFQRALGVFVVSDMKRVQNWIPKDMILESMKFEKEFLNKKFFSKEMWGNARFSIGLWIGGDATPTRFAYFPSSNRGKVVLNAEGSLLSLDEYNKAFPKNWVEPPKGDPAQVTSCPVCGNTLCLSDGDKIKQKELTWVIKTKKNLQKLTSLKKSDFESPSVKLSKDPSFIEISENDDGDHFVRVSMEISLQNFTDDTKKRIDEWWHTFVNPKFVPGDLNSLCSTRASMPGYFFLTRNGDDRPYDFVIHCTNNNCELNKSNWYERVPKENNTSIPLPFRKSDNPNISSSIPISAYTVDEQIYAKCPTFIIATTDKFANLPWDSRCASLFGNVDCYHDHFGFGRRASFSDSKNCNVPLLDKNNKRLIPEPAEFSDYAGFLPPSLIVQDELHLIEGPLGSMVGVYEMAVDVLCRKGSHKPKYLASSATIKEASSQVGTIFRKKARIFPRPGIFSDDNFFSIIHEDSSCSKSGPGRLYLGLCSGKAKDTLPIKATAILMSEIHKINENPEVYGVSQSELKKEIDPYWTHVSYFSDLQLMSKFLRYYGDDIKRDVKNYSPRRIGVANIVGTGKYPKAILTPITSDVDLSAWGVSVYCQNSKGNIAVALYDDNSTTGNLIWKSKKQKCSIGENTFFSDVLIHEIKKGATVWVAIICDNDKTIFHQSDSKSSWFKLENIKPKSSSIELPWSELLIPDKKDVQFPDALGNTQPHSGNPIRVEITGKRRDLNNKPPVTLSSETLSEELPKHLESLQFSLEKDGEDKTVDALLTSPVFGTGIDVDRLGLMAIMNQPKTTSGYIQATGRVGRRESGLVVDWLRARRARDLDHYENFVGYHRKIHQHVEPVTANPFSHESLKLCLGPVAVAILRNARAIQSTPISPKWAVDPEGPFRILTNKNGSSNEITALTKILTEIGKSDNIPIFRQNNGFNTDLEAQLENWLKLADKKFSKEPLIYGERNPSRPASSHVILGSQYHENRGYEAAFQNTRNSMRDTENAAIFYNQTNKVAIRPSQFLTRYGPGSLLPSRGTSLTAPSVSDMVTNLNEPIGNFLEPIDKKQSLKKIEIEDLRMIKRLYEINKGYVDFDNIHIFTMPSNASLNSITKHVGDNEDVYKAEIFPKWGVCSNHHGNPILGKIVYDSHKAASIRCPYCKEESPINNEFSTSFENSRFVLACKKGHMSDLDWTREIHRDTKCNEKCDDEYRSYVWNESGAGDNIVFRCLGIWTGDDHDQFLETTCDAEKRLVELKHASNEGFIECKGKFVEDHFRNAERCTSHPRLVLKNMMSLRSPINISTLVIEPKESYLYDKLVTNYARLFCQTKKRILDKTNPKWTSSDMANEFLETKNEGIIDIGDELINEIRTSTRKDLDLVYSELTKHLDEVSSGKASLSEARNLESELSSLIHGMQEGSIQKTGNTKSSKVVHPIRWTNKISGLRFEAMPYHDIKVTNVQTGYSREVESTEEKEETAEKFVQTRVGDIVSEFSKHIEKENVWYMGNQNIGEGIFIRLQEKDDDGNPIAADSMFDKDKKDFKEWSKFNEDVSNFVQLQLKDPKLSEQQRDHYETMLIQTHPLFVWWHSFAHQIITELAIDSGFTTTALNERIYFVNDKKSGVLSAGILLYVSTPGSDGTLGGLTSLVDDSILPKIMMNAERHLLSCSNDPVCSERDFNGKRYRGSSCHSCLMSPETTCSYQNRFLDRNLIRRNINA
jgi:hypothetical protein